MGKFDCRVDGFAEGLCCGERSIMTKTIVVVGTLDTKEQEIEFVRELISGRGHVPLVVDCGIMKDPIIEPAVSRHQVAKAGGTTIEEIVTRGDKDAAIRTMAFGATVITSRLRAEGKLDGVIALGGAQGTIIGTTIMQSLPLGVPKVMVSAIANGQATFGPFVGTKDIVMMHSVADILGLNTVTRQVLTEAAGAVIGMVEMALAPQRSSRPTVAITTAGVTTPCVMHARELLEAWGYEVIAFHCNGIGAKAMEELVETGMIQGILDLSPHDITDYLFGGLMPASPDRMEASCRLGVPQVVVPGCTDIILYGPLETVPPHMLDRKHVAHNPVHTHVKANRQEMAAVGRFIAERLSRAAGPVAVLIPERGFSQLNVVGGALFEPESDRGFVEGLMEELEENRATEKVNVVKLDMHINDPAFAEAVARTLHTLIQGKQVAL